MIFLVFSVYGIIHLCSFLFINKIIMNIKNYILFLKKKILLSKIKTQSYLIYFLYIVKNILIQYIFLIFFFFKFIFKKIIYIFIFIKNILIFIYANVLLSTNIKYFILSIFFFLGIPNINEIFNILKYFYLSLLEFDFLEIFASNIEDFNVENSENKKFDVDVENEKKKNKFFG